MAGRKLQDTSAAFAVAVAVVSVVFAVGAHVVIERPMRERIRKLVSKS